MRQGCCAAISLLAIAAVLCALILQSNTDDDHRSPALESPAACSARVLARSSLPVDHPARPPRSTEVPGVSMTPPALRAELQDWAENDFLLSFVPTDVPDRADIVQEALCRVGEVDPETIEDPAALRAYGATVVKRVTIEFAFGRRRVHPIVLLKGSHEFIDRQCEETGNLVESPEEEVERQLGEELLYPGLNSVPLASVSMRLLSSISPATTGASLHPLAPSAGQSIRGRHSRAVGTTSLLLRPAQVDTGGTPIDTGGMAFARLFPVHFRSVYHSRLRF